MTKYDSIDSDFGTEQTKEVTRKAKQERAQEVSEETKKFIRDRIGRIQFASAGATRKR